MFGFLYLSFGHFREDDEAIMRETMLRAIESRWKRADQDVFIATVILNPFHKTAPFALHPSLTNAGIYTLLDRLWKRFYKTNSPPDLWVNLLDYLGERGTYTGMQGVLSMIRLEAAEHVSSFLTAVQSCLLIYRHKYRKSNLIHSEYGSHLPSPKVRGNVPWKSLHTGFFPFAQTPPRVNACSARLV